MAPALRSVLLLLSLVAPSAWAAVLAIDYGTDWTKASLMKPGVPFDVLLNKDSKRKIHSSVGWNKADRLFGGDAFNIATRFPEDSFPSLKHLIGSKFNSNRTWYYTDIAHAVLMDTDDGRGTIETARKFDGSKYTVEELVAMEFAYVKSLAEDVAGEPVNELVLTVPAWFGDAERAAMRDAVEIAGMKTLALLSDGAAVAVNYAMTRSFAEKEYHVIYDAGAGSVRATIASFHSPDAKPESATKKKSKSKSKTPTKESVNVDILGYGYDTVAHGNELTKRIKDRFVAQFEEKSGLSLARDMRATARLWKEAERVKGVLSANTDSRSTVESLSNDVDFKTTLSRAEFETISEDLKARYAAPIVEALESSGLGWENITSVILMGGHSRVPMVQSAVRSAVGETSVSQNINTDEAAVLGAAFYAAGLSPQFKTKKIKVADVGVHDIVVSYEAEGKSGKRTITNKIFPRLSSKLGTKKTLTFKRKEDFGLVLSYTTPAPTSDGLPEILRVDLVGVSDALANLTSRGAAEPVVKVTLQLDEFGQLVVGEASAYGEVKDDSLSGKLKNLFGGGASSSSVEAEPTDGASSSSASGTSTSSSAAASETPASEAKKVEKNTVPLEVKVEYLGIRPLDAQAKSLSRSRLIALDIAEHAAEERAEAINLLEGYIYRLRDLLAEAESSETMFKEFSTEEEREKVRTLLEETAEWLIGIDQGVTTEMLRAKRAALEALENPIQGRHKEYKAIPDAMKDLRKALDTTETFLTSALKEIASGSSSSSTPSSSDSEEEPLPSRFTQEDLDEIRDLLATTATYLKERIDEVAGSPKNVDVPFRAAEIDQMGINLQRKVQRLSNRPKPRPLKKKAKTTSSSPSSSSATTETGSATSEEPKATEPVRDEL